MGGHRRDSGRLKQVSREAYPSARRREESENNDPAESRRQSAEEQGRSEFEADLDRRVAEGVYDDEYSQENQAHRLHPSLARLDLTHLTGSVRLRRICVFPARAPRHGEDQRKVWDRDSPEPVSPCTRQICP